MPRIILTIALVLPTLALAAAPDSLDRIASQREFDQLKRTYHKGRFAELPHVIYVADREAHRVYYVNSQKYAMHPDFVRAKYLSLESREAFFAKNYTRDDRRFVLGTIAWQPTLKRFTHELWDGDLATTLVISETHQLLQSTFFAPLAFKPNSLRQEEQSASLKDMPRVLASEQELARTSEVLNEGRAIGKLKLVRMDQPQGALSPSDIVVFQQAPISLTPVSGVVMARQGTPLAHVHMLAKGWKIPDAFLKDADTTYANLLGKWVVLTAKGGSVTLAAADCKKERCASPKTSAQPIRAPEVDLEWKQMTPLSQQRASDSVRFGNKAANLGELLHANLKGITVPPGFSIPFRYYSEFGKAIGLRDQVEAMLKEERFQASQEVRREKLGLLRAFIQRSPFSPELRAAVLEKVHREHAGQGLFVRSSTNSEDLPNFSGAGLYTTVPNVKGDDALIEAIKTVWASTWNFEAYEARQQAGIDHLAVSHAVLIQQGINADSAGVLITTDPFDTSNRDGVYINAKRGLGIKVVEGRKVPEQIIYRPKSNSVQVLTRSAEDTLLTFDEHGGVRTMPTYPDRAVLTDEIARRLAGAAMQVKRVFGNRHQDIEWLIVGKTIYVVQSRPYLG